MPETPPNLFRAPIRALVVLWACLTSGLGAVPVDDGGSMPRAETLFPQLEPILVAALDQSPTMVQESLSRLASGYMESAERAVLYPRIGGYGFANLEREERLSSDSTREGIRTYYDFSLTQPLFHWGSLQAQAEIGRIEAHIAERNYAEAYQGLANRIRDAYLHLVSQRIAQRNRALELERAQAQLEFTRQLAADGRVPASAVTTAEFAIESLVLQADRAEFAFDRLLRQFRVLTGHTTFAATDLPETIPTFPGMEEGRVLPLRTEYVTQRGYETSIHYFRAVRLLDIDRLRLRMTRNNLRPRFDVAVGVSQDQDNRTLNVEERFMVTRLYAGLRMNWSIWDSKRTQSLTRAAQARIRRSENSLRQLEQDLIDAAESAEKELGFAARSLRIAERAYSSAETSLSSAESMFRDGRASQDQVDVARLGLRNAEYAVCEARRDYLRTLANFLATIQADPLVARLQSEGRIPR